MIRLFVEHWKYHMVGKKDLLGTLIDAKLCVLKVRIVMLKSWTDLTIESRYDAALPLLQSCIRCSAICALLLIRILQCISVSFVAP